MHSFYDYGGRTFATYAAAQAYYQMREWFRGYDDSDEDLQHFIPQRFDTAQPQSFTQTNTETEEEMLEDHVQGIRKAVLKVSTTLPPLKGVINNKLTYRDAFKGRNNWVGNRQLCLVPYYIGTSSQYLTGTSNATAGNRDSVAYAGFFDININQNISGGALAGTAQPKCDIIGIKYATCYHDFQNTSSLPLFLKVHFFQAVLDQDVDPLGCYASGATNENQYTGTYDLLSTKNAFPATSGGETTSYVSGSSSNTATLNTIPYTNLQSKRQLTTNWKCIKSKSLTLAAGDTMRQTVIIRMNHYGIKERLQMEAPLYPKGCVACVFEMQGSLVIDTATGASGPTISGGDLSYCVTRKVQLSTMKYNARRQSSTFVGAGNLFSNNVVAESKIIGDNAIITDIAEILT